jgi:hypothetical protein
MYIAFQHIHMSKQVYRKNKWSVTAVSANYQRYGISEP